MTDFYLAETARCFAIRKHWLERKQHYAGLPYTVHLQDVVDVLAEFGHASPTMVAGGWLHDVAEDCGVRVEELEVVASRPVALLVHAVTMESGRNRMARVLATLPKTRAHGTDAVILKMADRIANVRRGGEKVEMYRREHAIFRAALYREGEADDMWEELRRLLQAEDGSA